MFILTCSGRRFIAVRAMEVSSTVTRLRKEHSGAIEVSKVTDCINCGSFVTKVLATISAITKG